MFIRFSTVGGEKGPADSERDPRGFAVKFYTEECNWNMTGNNTPIFFIRDPLKFGDLTALSLDVLYPMDSSSFRNVLIDPRDVLINRPRNVQ